MRNKAVLEERLIALMVVVSLVCGGAASSAVPPESLCDRAASDAADRIGVPVDILLAISRVETGRNVNGKLIPWPWTINADGKGSFYASKADAVTAAEAHLTDGTGTFDIGCFQLNIRWHGDGFQTFEDMFDPGKNADYAARFLMSLRAQSGNWAEAVAAYHSRTPELGQAYLTQVKTVLEDQGSGSRPSEPAIEPRANTFPLLQTGEQGSLGSLVPILVASPPLIGGGI